MRGSKVRTDKEAEFRREYLLTGNAAESARKVGIPPHTGHDLAKKAAADPAFQKARTDLYARALPDVERLMVETLTIAAQRAAKGPPDPVELAKKLARHGIKSASVQDPCPAYAQAVVAGYKALSAARKIDAENGKGATPPASVTVTISASTPSAAEPTPTGG